MTRTITRTITRIGMGRAVACLAMVALMAFSVPAGAQDEPLPRAEEIMAKCIDALGGKAAMQKCQARLTIGTFEVVGQGIKGPLVTYEVAPNKQYTKIELAGLGTIESGTNGDVHWEVNAMTGPRVLEGAEKALSDRMTRFNAVLLWQGAVRKSRVHRHRGR